MSWHESPYLLAILLRLIHLYYVCSVLMQVLMIACPTISELCFMDFVIFVVFRQEVMEERTLILNVISICYSNDFARKTHT